MSGPSAAARLVVHAGDRLVEIGALPACFRWLAQDADGSWYAYIERPVANDNLRGWDAARRSMLVGKGAPNARWDASLHDLSSPEVSA
jgi:hypothetical protein